MIDAVYVLNENPGGIDVLHRNPHEECNTDDAKGITPISADAAVDLLIGGHARACQHCLSGAETGGTQTLDVQNHLGDPVLRMPADRESAMTESEAPAPEEEAAEEVADAAEEELNEEAEEEAEEADADPA